MWWCNTTGQTQRFKWHPWTVWACLLCSHLANATKNFSMLANLIYNNTKKSRGVLKAIFFIWRQQHLRPMPYWEMLLNGKNGNRIFQESSLENLKMEADVFIVVSKLFSSSWGHTGFTLLFQQGALWSTPGSSIGSQFFWKNTRKMSLSLSWAHSGQINNGKSNL